MFTNLLRAFAFLAEADALADGEERALNRLYDLLEARDPWLLITRRGPEAYALLRHFGLISPYAGQERFDLLDSELACKTLLAFHLWRESVLQLADAERHFANFSATYTERAPRRP